MNELGKLIRDKRREKFLSQGELAKLLNEKYRIKIQYSTISGIETGRADLRLDVAKALSDCLNIDLKLLIEKSKLLQIEKEFEERFDSNFKVVPRRR